MVSEADNPGLDFELQHHTYQIGYHRTTHPPAAPIISDTCVTGRGGSDGIAAVHKVQEFGADVVAMDLSMPIVNGLWAMREIIALRPPSRS